MYICISFPSDSPHNSFLLYDYFDHIQGEQGNTNRASPRPRNAQGLQPMYLCIFITSRRPRTRSRSGTVRSTVHASCESKEDALMLCDGRLHVQARVDQSMPFQLGHGIFQTPGKCGYCSYHMLGRETPYGSTILLMVGNSRRMSNPQAI